MNIVIKLGPNAAQLGDWQAVYRRGASLSFTKDVKANIEKSAKIITKAAAGSAPVYGVNTGFGKLAQTRIAANDLSKLQRNLILSHASGVGPDMEAEIVRLMMGLKLASLSRGASGVSWPLFELLQNMLAKDVIPLIPAKGSVGASGDLAPLAHMAAVMIGEGRASYNGRFYKAQTALKKAGLKPIRLGPKEGLALINGTQFSTAYALAGFFDLWQLLGSALVTGALATDAAMGSSAPFRPAIHELRGHPGQIDAAKSLRALMKASPLRASHREDDERVQDPYCLRCQPQVMGAVIDMLRHVAAVLAREGRAVTDNPLIVQPSGDIVSGGNFHAEPIAFAADQMALAIAEIGSISQRRIAMLVDPAMNFGLPAFLSPDPGVNSGFMIAEVTSAALMSENKQRAAPCSTDSVPTSANQEDHVSMAAHGARRLMEMNENLAQIIAVEWLIAAQGVELRAVPSSPVLMEAVAALRTHVPALKQDRYMALDLKKAADLVKSGALCAAAGPDLLPDWQSPCSTK